MRRILVVAAFLTAMGCARPKVESWVADPHRRVYPGAFGRNQAQRTVKLEAARNEYVCLQLGTRSAENARNVSAEASALSGPGGATIPRESIRVLYPGLLPVDENGQLTPDPLMPAPAVDLAANRAQGIWIDFTTPRDAAPGRYSGAVRLRQDAAAAGEFQIELELLPLTLPDVARDHFYFNILFDPGSVARMHKVQPWSDAHWALLDKYVRNWARHSQDSITVFFLEDPWEGDTGFAVASVVEWKLPGEWGQADRFEFDYTRFDRFVKMCLDAGISRNLQAWSPVNMPHRDYAVIHYSDTQAGQVRKLKVTAGTPEYERVWSQFAASFESHLVEKGWLGITTVGLDEISTENLDRIMPAFRKVAPRLRLMVSGGDEKGKYQEFSPEMAFHYSYVNSEVPLPDRAARRKQGKRTLLYTANSPLRPNTFLFSEPLESRMIPWLVWKHDFDGYIRWAWNFWVEGFREQPFYKWRSGDMFFVYPGQDGPVDSIRSAMLRLGAQDYECLWMLRERGVGGKEVDDAVEMATREADPKRVRHILPSDMPGARGRLNRLLLNAERGK